jgi:hypothetical protein
MKSGVVLPNIGLFADVALLAELGARAEAVGWDGVFVWDALGVAMDDPRLEPACDAWIALGLIAAGTERVTIGPMITPLSRRRPWVVGRQTLTLDHLSGGRLVLPVGLGALEDEAFARVNEETDRVRRAERLDESLAIIERIWRGEPFTFQGTHYQVDGLAMKPSSVQQPRIPVWVVALWPRRKSMRRALAWDGVLPAVERPDGSRSWNPVPDDIRAIKKDIEGAVSDNYEIVVEIDTSEKPREEAKAIAEDYADAGVTWWLQPVWQMMYRHPAEVAPLRDEIDKGPLLPSRRPDSEAG